MSEPAAAPRTAKVELRTAPLDLATIKDDLGIDVADTSNDAWLQRRVDGLWSRFQTYTGRTLALESGWVDDWGELITNAKPYMQPMALQPLPRGSVYLRVFPVSSITKITFNQADVDVAQAVFDPESGKLLSLSGQPVVDLDALLINGRARIEYVAGFETLPDVLYEALIGALAIQWQARAAQSNGTAVGGFLPTRISAIDVGEVDLSLSPNVLVEQSAKRAGSVDPLLGPYATLLDEFVDYRSIMAATAQPTSAALPASIKATP